MEETPWPVMGAPHNGPLDVFILSTIRQQRITILTAQLLRFTFFQLHIHLSPLPLQPTKPPVAHMLRIGVCKALRRGGGGDKAASSVDRVGIKRGFTPGDARKEGEGSVLLADRGKLGTSVYHKLNVALLGVVPVAVATSPSIVSEE